MLSFLRWHIKVSSLGLLLICSFTFISLKANANSQGDTKISISGSNITFRNIFKAIRQQTGLYVMYNNQVSQINQDDKVNINFKNARLDDVLAYLFASKNLTWIYSDVAIILNAKDKPVENRTGPDSSIVTTSVTGRVMDAQGNAIPGATVMVDGHSIGAATDAEGNFSIPKVPMNAMITISSVGYETRKFTVKGKSILAQLNVSVSKLDETVVMAYGTTSRRNLIGNISTVKAEDIEKNPVANPLLALQGRVTGVFISQASGLPGTGVTVRVQGQNSLNNGNDPLYVIDGVPYTSQLLPSVNYNGVLGNSGANTMGNPLSFINPNDIESIDILKDADATSIYGSRAANGAVLITTKKGRIGDTRIKLNLQSGWGKVTSKLDLLNIEQYLEMRHEAKLNDHGTINATDYDINGTWDTTRYTDWQKELIGGTARYTNLQGSISGGSSELQYLVSGTYHRETTVYPGQQSDQKGAVHFSINSQSKNRKFKLGFVGNYMLDRNNLFLQDLTNLSLILPPDAPSLKNADGSWNWAPDVNDNSTWINPLAILNNKYKNSTNNLIGNITLSYELLHGLNIKANAGYTNLTTSEIITLPLTGVAPEIRQYTDRYVEFSNGSISSYIIEPQVSFNPFLGKSSFHEAELLIGATFQEKNSNQHAFAGTGQNSDIVLEDIKSAPNVTVTRSIAEVYKYNALFGKFSYSYRQKLLANLALRRDGSSRFGVENIFHNFFSIGAGYIFSSESMVKNSVPFMSFGKIRFSYGTTGNDQIGEYSYLSLYSPRTRDRPYQNEIGLSPISLSNPYLQWEETKKLQAGLDLGFLQDRILLNIGYYHNRSSNQLQTYALPIITGFNGIRRNFPATVQNTGWELALNSVNIKKYNFTWQTSITATFQRNKLIKYENLEKSSYANSYIIGQPITINKVFNYYNVDPASGIYSFQDKDGKITSSPNYTNDRIGFVSSLPTVYGGLQNSIVIKNFSLDFLLQYSRQNAVNSVHGNFPGVFASGPYSGVQAGNQPITVLDRWKGMGDKASIQKYSSEFPPEVVNALFAMTFSNGIYSDASYVRLKNISLAYALEANLIKRLHMQQVRFYVQAQNLFTVTHYKGLDPESASLYSLPPLRVITLGVDCTF